MYTRRRDRRQQADEVNQGDGHWSCMCFVLPVYIICLLTHLPPPTYKQQTNFKVSKHSSLKICLKPPLRSHPANQGHKRVRVRTKYKAVNFDCPFVLLTRWLPPGTWLLTISMHTNIFSAASKSKLQSPVFASPTRCSLYSFGTTAAMQELKIIGFV